MNTAEPCREVLIVEDDEGVRDTLKLYLELIGYHVSTATNGKEGLDLLKKNSKPCIILLDLMMPVMNGWQFIDSIQKDPVLASIPIAIVTAFSDRTEGIHANAVLKKPIDVESMLKVVHQYCGQGIYE